jgi:beta-glucosidase
MSDLGIVLANWKKIILRSEFRRQFSLATPTRSSYGGRDSQGQALQPHPASGAGWQQIYPRGLYDTLTRIRREYGASEVMITENGVPDDIRDSSRPTVDDARVEFLEQHLRAVHQAITDGCRVTGYHAWSLLDNFEWAAGYTQRWGLVQVDFDTQQRTPKSSASWYATVAASNRLPPK